MNLLKHLYGPNSRFTILNDIIFKLNKYVEDLMHNFNEFSTMSLLMKNDFLVESRS